MRIRSLFLVGYKSTSNFKNVSSKFTYNNRVISSLFSSSTEENSISNLTASEFREKFDISVKGMDLNLCEPFLEFDKTPFSSKLKKVFNAQKYISPTPIQAQAWPIILQTKDCISIARTGSGKTCGFLLPALHNIEMKIPEHNEKKASYKSSRSRVRRVPKVLVVAPTRELSIQIESEVVKYATAVGMNSLCVYGGSSKVPQIKALSGPGSDIVIGTPGRINDLVEMGVLDLRQISYLVLDEADRMLDMGFEPQIRAIIDNIPDDRQTVFFTATWPREVQTLALEFLKSPVLITVGSTDTLNANKAIEQHIMVVNNYSKEEKLLQLFSELQKSSTDGEIPKAIIFMSRKMDCDNLTDVLLRDGFSASAIHGDLSQQMRTLTLDRFRKGYNRILVATDVASRGIDIKDIEVVVNYDFPSDLESYVHRIGRTARGDNTGKSYSFMTMKDQPKAADLIKLMERADQKIPQDLLKLAGTSNSGKRQSSRFGNSSSFRGRDAGYDRSRSSDRYGDRYSNSSRRPREAYLDDDSPPAGRFNRRMSPDDEYFTGAGYRGRDSFRENRSYRPQDNYDSDSEPYFRSGGSNRRDKRKPVFRDED